MKMKRPPPQNDITGIILANQWDEDGNVIGVSVYTDLEEIYIVAQTKQIKELVNLIHQKTGILIYGLNVSWILPLRNTAAFHFMILLLKVAWAAKKARK